MKNKSFKIGSLIGMALMGTLFLATAHADPTSLKDYMKEIGNLFKEISTEMADTTQYPKLAKDADQLITLFTAVKTTVKTQPPESILALPPPQQLTAVAQFQGLIQQEIDNAKALEHAFQTNNKESAESIVKQMGEIKGEGHDLFNN